MSHIETVFIDNLNERELRRSGKNNNLVSDMHLAFVSVGYNCPFVGERLADSNFGRRFGLNVVSIQRGERLIPIPTGSMRIFPGDTLGVVGTDEQIQKLLTIIEQADKDAPQAEAEIKMDFTSIVLTAGSPVVGKPVGELDLRGRYSAMLVSIERKDGVFEKPTAESVLHPGDNIWVVGDKQLIRQLS